MPKPAAEFSPLAITRSMEWSFIRSGRRSLTMVRPGRPKMSPMKRIFMLLGAARGLGEALVDGITRVEEIGVGLGKAKPLNTEDTGSHRVRL